MPEMTRKYSVETGLSVDQREVLETAGIDEEKLRMAFAEVDQQGDNELELHEFREFWGLVFPERPMTETAWKYTETMFREIDNDASNKISFAEIIQFLEKSLKHELQRAQRPASFREWCWVYCGNGNTGWLKSDDKELRLTIIFSRILEFAFIILAMCAMMIETLPESQDDSDGIDLRGTEATKIIEGVCVGYFVLHFIGYTIGYPFTSMVADENGATHSSTTQAKSPRDAGHVEVNITKFFTSFETWVAVFSIMPYIVSLLTSEAAFLSAFASFRLTRVIRVLRLYYLYTGTKNKVPELLPALTKSLMSLWFLFLLIVISMCLSASFVYYAEQDEATFNYTEQKWYRDPDSRYTDAGSPLDFQSIPEALWWSIVTLTTVGYGDNSPKTFGGKLVALVSMFGGLIVVGYPITILTSTFQMMEQERLEYEDRTERHRELYEGIKTWVASTEMQLKTSREALQATDRIVNKGDQTAKAEARKELIEQLTSVLEARLSGVFSRIERKLKSLETKKRQRRRERGLPSPRKARQPTEPIQDEPPLSSTGLKLALPKLTLSETE